ncbi:hypothetical protein GSS20_26210 (plasmid) [Vibrio parahaemolyticus]|nr:hypothetical protein [Vibrio parahaemolyticus]UJW92646.1 hypothetical protein JHS83_24350 [Vibrio parahaemolyticus]UJX06884.1 hypothetical protein JHS88_24365 [Vibrio parahaemolyticus]WCZ09654.1 hypothetical protein GSR97_25690 [Vibrio parahaemolyticus]WCZ14810.1 hypothetical protein GSS20_26210 [Vibrio parahaemolyticus]
MYQSKLLDAYKKAQNYVQDKQIAHDLGISNQKISKIRQGERYLTENEALFIAEKIGLSEEEVLVYLAADKSKTYKAQQAWEKITKKFNGLGLSSISMICGMFALWLGDLKVAIAKCALCLLCSIAKFRVAFVSLDASCAKTWQKSLFPLLISI